MKNIIKALIVGLLAIAFVGCQSPLTSSGAKSIKLVTGAYSPRSADRAVTIGTTSTTSGDAVVFAVDQPVGTVPNQVWTPGTGHSWAGDATGTASNVTSFSVTPNRLYLTNTDGGSVEFLANYNVATDLLTPEGLSATASGLGNNKTYNALVFSGDGTMNGSISMVGAIKTGASSRVLMVLGNTMPAAIAAKDAFVNDTNHVGSFGSGDLILCLVAPGMLLTTDNQAAVVGTSGSVLNLTLGVNGTGLLGGEAQFTDSLKTAFSLKY